jgi:YD repeat-containing protein
MSDVTNAPKLDISVISATSGEDLYAAEQSLCDTIDGAPAISTDAPTSSALVDWDHKGRVTRSRFVDGHVCQFRYDEHGSLYGFIYAKLAWSSNDGYIWSAQDSANLYVVQGRITVNVDGTLTIERDSFNRTLKLNGLIVDDYRDGRALETMRQTAEPKPADLLADVHKKHGVPTKQDFLPLDAADLAMHGSAPILGHHTPDAGESSNAKVKSALRTTSSTSMLKDSVVERSFVTDDLRLSHQERAHQVGLQAQRESGIHQAPAPVPDNGAEKADALPGNKRPLAVGKRLNRLRVVEDTAAQTPVYETPANNPQVAVRLAFEESRLAVLEKLFGQGSLILAPCLDALGTIYYERRRVNDAREAHERALMIRCRHLGATHADTAINLHALGRIYHEWGRYTEAEEQYAQAIRVSGKGLQKARFMRESGLTDDSHILEHIRRLLAAVHSLAKLYSEQQRRHLCQELLNTATGVRNSIDAGYHRHFDHVFEALTALASSDHEDSRAEPAAYTKRSKAFSA